MIARKLVGFVLCLIPLLVLSLFPAEGGRGGTRRGEAEAPGLTRLEQRAARSLGPGVAQRISTRLRAEVLPARVWTETMFQALATASSELHLMDEEGLLEGEYLHAVGQYTAISIVGLLVDLHPELAPMVAQSTLDDGDEDDDGRPSPIGNMCNCTRRGAQSCGCTVQPTGPGACEAKILCKSYGRAFCATVNMELCIARELIDIVSPIS